MPFLEIQKFNVTIRMVIVNPVRGRDPIREMQILYMEKSTVKQSGIHITKSHNSFD